MMGQRCKSADVKDPLVMLGAAIFQRALLDLNRRPSSRQNDGPEALEWVYAESDDLDFWCGVCRVEPDDLRRVARERLAQLRRPMPSEYATAS